MPVDIVVDGLVDLVGLIAHANDTLPLHVVPALAMHGPYEVSQGFFHEVRVIVVQTATER